jgi:hypothetical protein
LPCPALQYDNAGLIQSVLDDEVAARGLSLQDFLFHTLRNCHVVLMAARDEAASFRIFSTLNGRGMDLSMVDKLKADLLEVRGGDAYSKKRHLLLVVVR